MAGDPDCFSTLQQYWTCCALNDNPIGILYDVMLLLYRVPPQGSTNKTTHLLVLQGLAIRHVASLLQNKEVQQVPGVKDFLTVAEPFQLSHDTGAGTVWPFSVVAAQAISANFDFGFPIDGTRSFLELGSGTGLVSMVALSLGFAVLSTDLCPISMHQRQLSVEASFGPTSSRAKRFRQQQLDLFNASTWPARRVDVTCMTRLAEDMTQFCVGFRQVLRATLKPMGVGIYAGGVFGMRKTERACVESDEVFHAQAHLPLEDGSWIETDLDFDNHLALKKPVFVTLRWKH